MNFLLQSFQKLEHKQTETQEHMTKNITTPHSLVVKVQGIVWYSSVFNILLDTIWVISGMIFSAKHFICAKPWLSQIKVQPSYKTITKNYTHTDNTKYNKRRKER